MKMEVPKKVEYIIEQLQKHGYQAYAVGGCVRDTLLSRKPDDWDITTEAKPMQVKEIFPRTVDTGLQHGTVTILLGKEGFEVTTYRIDGEYEDNRHPKDVVFTGVLAEDLKRRDFTMNAMAYNQEVGLVDIFGGRADLEKKLIRCVGNPMERFQEDALRILRAVRFAAQLGFSIEENTRAAVQKLAPTLSRISAERIQVELIKLLTSQHPEIFREAWRLGITAVILPEFDQAMQVQQNNPHHCYSVGEHILHSLAKVPADKVLRLTLLFHDIGKPNTHTTDEEGIDHFYQHAFMGEKIAKGILRRLKMDNDTIFKVTRLIHWHDYHPLPIPKAVRHAVYQVGEDLFPMLLQVQQADILAQSTYKREEKLEKHERIKVIYRQILEEKACLSLKELAVTGSDLIAYGMKPGKEIGETLTRLLELVLDDSNHNTKEYLLAQIPAKVR